jgi:esterase/lipase
MRIHMKKFFKWFAGIILLLAIIYLTGPKPPRPEFSANPQVPSDLAQLEQKINNDEKSVRGLKPDNEARIVWADSLKQKTNTVFLYLHGFTGSQVEGNPVHRDVAKHFHSNLYLSRLEEHGIDRGDSTMINLNADNYYASAEEAFQIAKQLGNEVILIGTSAGGALSLFLASRHPEIKAVVLYSPGIKLVNPAAALLNKPWGLQIGRIFSGGKTQNYEAESPEHAQYWTLKYRVEALVSLVNFYTNALSADTYSKIKCPVFLGYYYKNDEEQDPTASVPAMLEMFDKLGTPPALKYKVAFPEAGAHVISSSIRSKDWKSVENETIKFLQEVVKL